MDEFQHERLDAYKIAIRFVRLANQVTLVLPRGGRHLADQLSRAATSVALNIAEGAGEFSAPEKARFYRIARRSATECAAILDVCTTLELAETAPIIDCREPLLRLVAILTKMVLGLVERASSEALR